MNWWQYLMLVNIYLLLFYGFYALLLRKETFFQLNRVYLVTASLMSFFIPLIQSDWVKELFITRQVQLTIYKSPVIFYRYQPVHSMPVTVGQIAIIAYLAGVVFLTTRLAWQLFSLKKIIDQPGSAMPYSFFGNIKLVANHYDNELVSAHERVHAGQWHSADVLLIEAVMIVNWFNPVVYFYRSAIKHIHEFIADNQMIKSGTSKADYALLLLSQTFDIPAHQLVNPFFNHSLLKQRIMMLQKNKSQRIALIKYCLSAPLFILMLILSSATVNNSKTIKYFNKKAEQVFLKQAAISSGGDSFADHKRSESSLKLTTSKNGKTIATYILGSLAAKPDTIPADNGPVFTSVEQVPEFPGGIKAFGDYLAKNIRYPAQSRKNNAQGTVIITFIVEKDGSLSNARVKRSVEKEIDAEALRVIKLSPNWTPGIQNGKTVRVSYSVPIAFTLEDSKPKSNPTGKVIEFKGPDKISLASINMIVTKTDTGKKSSDVYNINEKPVAPLYILDGKEVPSASGINPENIESISVLKDRSSIALYGEKGKYGVIIIKTKATKLMLSLPAND